METAKPYTAGGIRFQTMYFLKQRLQLLLQSLILIALVELADKMSSGLEHVETELKCSAAKILLCPVRAVLYIEWELKPYHTSGMIPETDATSIHHPVIRVTKAIAGKTFGLRPGSGHVTENHIHSAV